MSILVFSLYFYLKTKEFSPNIIKFLTFQPKHVFSHYVSAQKQIRVDQNESKWSKWTKSDQIKQSRPNGPNRNKVNQIDRIGLNRNKVGRIKTNEPNKTDVDNMDQIGPNKNKVDRIGPMWIE